MLVPCSLILVHSFDKKLFWLNPFFPLPLLQPSITDQYKSILSPAVSGFSSVENQTSQMHMQRLSSRNNESHCSDRGHGEWGALHKAATGWRCELSHTRLHYSKVLPVTFKLQGPCKGQMFSSLTALACTSKKQHSEDTHRTNFDLWVTDAGIQLRHSTFNRVTISDYSDGCGCWATLCYTVTAQLINTQPQGD